MKFELIPCPQEPEYWNLLDGLTGKIITTCATIAEVLAIIGGTMANDEIRRDI